MFAINITIIIRSVVYHYFDWKPLIYITLQDVIENINI